MFISYGNTIFDDQTGDVFEREHREKQEVEYDPTDKLDYDADAERDELVFWDELAKEEAKEDERPLREYEAKCRKDDNSEV